jgi:hypothetical protein
MPCFMGLLVFSSGVVDSFSVGPSASGLVPRRCQSTIGRDKAPPQAHLTDKKKRTRPSLSQLKLTPADLDPSSSSLTLASISTFIDSINNRDAAEALAGPFFGASLFPYLAFLYFLDVDENETPKGVTIGFATCLLFVFLTIPAAIAAQVNYGVSLADCDWLHGSAESLLTMTNLVTVVVGKLECNLPSAQAHIKTGDVELMHLMRF